MNEIQDFTALIRCGATDVLVRLVGLVFVRICKHRKEVKMRNDWMWQPAHERLVLEKKLLLLAGDDKA